MSFKKYYNEVERKRFFAWFPVKTNYSWQWLKFVTAIKLGHCASPVPRKPDVFWWEYEEEERQ